MYKSQAGQDRFILNVLKNKMYGYFLEIGSHDPIHINNTCILEKFFKWKGIMIEYEEAYLPRYKKIRTNSRHVIQDARTIDYKELLKDSPKNIEYLQVDLDVKNNSTMEVLEKLDKEVMDDHTFAIVTFEHDIYDPGEYASTRIKSRELLQKRGYVLVFPDINHNDPNIIFEDWYVHPSLVDMDYVHEIIELNEPHYTPSTIVEKTINHRYIKYPLLSWIMIGPSETNIRGVKLNRPWERNMKILFLNKYSDRFQYIIKDGVLFVKRADADCGWGQYLIGYYTYNHINPINPY